MIKYVYEHQSRHDAFPEPYWSNTSSNSIIRDLVEKTDAHTKEELERLVEGGTIEKQIHEDITYNDIYESEELLWKSISTFDSSESFYQGFFLSLLYEMPNYSARSNREEGIGRPDIVLYPQRPTDPAYIFELKARKKFSEMQGGLDEAFAQIEDRKYEDGILDEGYIGSVSFGICFCKKTCIVGRKR